MTFNGRKSRPMTKIPARDKIQIRTLIEAKQIEKRLDELALELSRVYKNEPLTMVVVLEGAFIFAADLIRRFPRDFDLRFLTIRASSYLDDLVTSGKVGLEENRKLALEKRHVLVLDDILDSGLTLSMLLNTCKAQKPLSLRSCVLLKKLRCDGPAKVAADFVGFEVEDHFVVGYGLDMAGSYRHLPYIGCVEETK